MAGIIGLATASSKHTISQGESCSHAMKFSCSSEREKLVLERLYRRTEIEQRSIVFAERESYGRAGVKFFPDPVDAFDKGPSTAQRMVAYNEFANRLSVAASRQAIANAEIKSSEITHLITVSCTGFAAPGFDLHLMTQLPLGRQTFRTNIGFMGCHGTMNALRVAQGFLSANPEAVILLCAAEICSIHFQYGRTPDDLVANSLFADGSAAIVMRNEPGVINYHDSISYVVADSDEAMSWRVGDNGFTMSLSPEVPRLIEQYLPPFLETWLAKHGLKICDIHSWAIHPGGPRILDAVETSLRLAPDAVAESREVLSEFGNMSSPTVLFVLEKILTGRKSPQFPCVALAFGPGLTIEAALLMS